MIDTISQINSAINNVVWGVPALVLLIGTGVIMTFRSRFFQFSHFGHAMAETVGSLFKKKDTKENKDNKSISQFQALCTALSATIGTGNIAGIAYAITMCGHSVCLFHRTGLEFLRHKGMGVPLRRKINHHL